MRTILRTLLLFLATTSLLAEPPEEDILRPRIPTGGTFFVGFDVGLNTTWFDGNPIYRAFFESEEESRLFRSAFGFEPFGSLYLGLRMSPTLRLKLRADYDVRTADRKGATSDSCPLIDATTGERIGSIPVGVEKEYSLGITYLTLALVAEYHIGQAFIYGGLSYSIPMKRRFAETDRILDQNSFCVYFDESDDATREITAELTDTDNLASIFGIKLGVGYMIEMASDLHLVPQIGVDYPLGSALEADEPFVFRGSGGASAESIETRLNRHMYFRVLQASIGLRYGF